MITLMVDGVILDMTPISLSIKKENNAFTFGKLQLSRTQSFSIKKTGKNMSVLGRGDFVGFGPKERKLHDAYMYGAGINAVGKLYVNEVDDNFKCMFIFGDLLPLKEIAEVKKMSEVLEPYDVELLLDTSLNADESNLPYYACVRYWNKWAQEEQYLSRAKYLPSYDVRKLFEYANNIFNVPFDLSPVLNYRLVQPQIKNAERKDIVLAKDGINTFSANQNTKLMFFTYQGTLINDITGRQGDVNSVNIKCYDTHTIGTLTFPEDFPDDIFLVADYTHYERWSGQVVVDLLFLGGYEFDWGIRTISSSISQEGERATTGEPLAGRTIDIPLLKNRTYYSPDRTQQILVTQRLSFYKKSDFHNTKGGVYLQYRGFTKDASPFNFTFPSVTRQVKNEEVGVWYSWAQDNLPSMSFIELYNVVAFLQNKYITYQNGKITMNSLDFEKVVFLKKIIKVEKIERRGAISAQSAVVEWNYSDVVPEALHRKIIYNTENENLDEEKTMFKIPFSPSEPLRNNDIFIDDVRRINYDNDWVGTNIEWQGNVHSIGIAGEGGMLKYVSTPYSALYAFIQNISTRISVECELSLFEYEKIKENNIIYYGNARWVWISSNWQKNKAKFVLQKI